MAQTEQQAIDEFRTYLELVYSQQPAPCLTEWPLSTDKPFNYVEVDITLIQKDRNRIIHLDEIFHSIPVFNRRRVLLQGPAGSGKSTLAWKASKKWASGESFTEFELFITLPLNDPALHAAKILEDIVPRSLHDELRKNIVSYIKKCDGKKVAFLLDGWDQFQQSKCSYIVKLVRGEVLTLASVVVTARNHTLPFPFHPPASMMLSGFTRNQVLEYLVTLPFAPVEFQILIGLCSHPLNAAIVKEIQQVGRFSESRPPSTSTDLVCDFIRNCLLRFLQHDKDADILFREELHQFLGREEEGKKFERICKLAFYNVLRQKRVLAIGDLQAYNINPENSTELLGLIRKKSFLVGDYYEFIHETIQEFLAALCMVVEKNQHRDQCLLSILERNPSTMVVPFYAGLSHTAFKDTLFTVLKDFEFPDCSAATIPALEDGSHATQCKRLLTVVKAIYEAQSPNLCNVFAERVDKLPVDFVHGYPQLVFGRLPEPLQYLHVAYFLANASSLAKRICVVFSGTLHVLSAELFVHHLLRASERKQLKTLKVYLDLGFEVEEAAVAVIAQLIKKTSIVSGLILGWSSETNACHALRSLVESVLVSTSLESLYFSRGLFTEQHVWYLILLLSCSKYLKALHLSMNYLGVGVSLLAIALKHNSTLTDFNLSDCGIGSSQLRRLRKSLKTNLTLKYLDISFNPFPVFDLFKVLESINNSGNHSLQVLRHSHRFTGGDRVIIECLCGGINYVRHNRNLPELRLPHAGEEIALRGGSPLGELFKRTPLTYNVDLMSSTIHEVDAPGSIHEEPPEILSVFQAVASAISNASTARQSTARQSTAHQSTSTTSQTITICEDDSGIHINF